ESQHSTLDSMTALLKEASSREPAQNAARTGAASSRIAMKTLGLNIVSEFASDYGLNPQKQPCALGKPGTWPTGSGKSLLDRSMRIASLQIEEVLSAPQCHPAAFYRNGMHCPDVPWMSGIAGFAEIPNMGVV